MTAKRASIVRAARTVFSQVGYLGASIDVIATAAGASTRTIYNHFEGKEQLFATVLLESSEEVAMALEALVDRRFRHITDLEADLVEFAKDWLRLIPEFAAHFVIVRRINAELEDLPDTLYEAWRDTGPRRVQHVLAAELARLDEQGLLRVDDAELAAEHLGFLLVAGVGNRVRSGQETLTDTEIDRIAARGTRAFLHGYHR